MDSSHCMISFVSVNISDVVHNEEHLNMLSRKSYYYDVKQSEEYT